MSPVPNDGIVEECHEDRYIFRKDSVESTSSVDSVIEEDHQPIVSIHVPKLMKDCGENYIDVSDQCYLSGCSDSDHAESTITSVEAKEDSGVEADQGGVDFIPPDNELSEKIIQQVEFYFSDANITKDAFLLKHVRRNKEGYVSLKLIASFKRVKHICKDWQVVAYALKKSQKLQINENGTKIRRIEALPDYDETTPSRTVIAVNLPSEKPTVESVAEIFRKCGEIALIRILRPGNPVPNDIRQFVSKHAELGNSVCAVVEFEQSESSRKAVDLMNSKDNWRSLQVFELTKTAKKNAKKTQPKKDPEAEKTVSKPTRQHLNSESGEKNSQDERKRKRSRNKKSRVDNLRRDSGSDRSESDSNRSMTHTPDIPSLSSSPVGSPRHRYLPPRSSPIPSPENSSRHRSSIDTSPSNSPWMPRHRLSAAGNSFSMLSTSAPCRRLSETGKQSNVIRMPKGPDGTRGFSFMRQRSVSAPIEVPVPQFMYVMC